MTREEAISLIKSAQLMLINPTTNEPVSDLYAALEMAIQALEQMPISLNDINNALEASFRNGVRSAKVEQEPCDDAISREDAEQMFRNIRSHLKPQDYKSAEEFNTRDLMLLNAEQMIHALPPVTQKSGKWIEKEGWDGDVYYECSVCGESFCLIDGTPTDNMYNFCPNCGAKMVEPQERSRK